MLSPVTHVILNFIAILYIAKGNALLKDESTKNFERDFQLCMDNFVVHTDIIIRTTDSRELGAKYLNEMDVDSRLDCKRFCCETNMCDVFIYEEKNPGSCYLFHCGPPHDFKCKFTNHSSYSSAVLTIVNPQQTLQIEEQIRRIKQEHELKSLRKMSESGSFEYAYTEPTTVVTHHPKIPILTTPIVNKTVCTRNQYECKATKECIAIYNVCDGIPQCADGSDESADLGCPTEKPTPVSQMLLQRPLLPVQPDLSNYQQMVQRHKSYAPMYEHIPEQENLKPWQSPNSAQYNQMMSQQQNVQYPINRIMLSQPQMNIGYPRYQWEYPPYFDPNKESYNNPNIALEQNKVFPYEQEQPRIFHHKRPGVINEGGDRTGYDNKLYMPYYNPSNREAWQEGQQIRMDSQAEIQPETKINRLDSQAEAPQLEPQEQPQEIIVDQSRSKVPAESVSEPQLEPKPHISPKPQKDVQPEPSYPIQKIEPHPTVAPQLVNNPVPQQVNNSTTKATVEQSIVPTESKIEEKKVVETETVHPKVIIKVEESKPVEVNKNDEIQTKKRKEEIQQLREPSLKKMEEKTVSVAEHFLLQNIEDESFKPKGAVISLAIGLTVTAIMVVLITCRLRVVRRRGRRRHEPYAHDADYLVNGMYL